MISRTFAFVFAITLVLLHHVGEEESSAYFLLCSLIAAEHVGPERRHHEEIPRSTDTVLPWPNMGISNYKSDLKFWGVWAELHSCTWEDHADVGAKKEVDNRVDEEEPAEPPERRCVSGHRREVHVVPLDTWKKKNIGVVTSHVQQVQHGLRFALYLPSSCFS